MGKGVSEKKKIHLNKTLEVILSTAVDILLGGAQKFIQRWTNILGKLNSFELNSSKVLSIFM